MDPSTGGKPSYKDPPPTPPSSPLLPAGGNTTKSPAISSNKSTLYEVLNVHPFASDVEIRRSYYKLCKQYHPDKVGDSVEGTELQYIQRAYEVLGDSAKRMLYDIKNDIYFGEDKVAKHSELNQIREQRAKLHIENMQIEYQSKIAYEEKCGGIIIVKAQYGNLRLREEYQSNFTSIGRVEDQHLEGPFIDVTIPLQCQVENSKFLFSSEAGASLEYLDGFYRPAAWMEDVDMCLYVLYKFKDTLHELTVLDGSPIAMPLRSHRIIGVEPSGPYAPTNVPLFMKEWGTKQKGSNPLVSKFGGSLIFVFGVGMIGYLSIVFVRYSSHLLSPLRRCFVWR